MDVYDKSMARDFKRRLAERLDHLRKDVQDENAAAQLEDAQEVRDFKDIADVESLGAVDDAQAAHAARELREVQAALRRIDDDTYGRCLGCGEPIDLRRLHALPTAALCTACQAKQERASAPR